MITILSKFNKCTLKILFIISICLGIYVGGRLCHQATDGFTILKISSKLPFNTDWEITDLQSEKNKSVAAILTQKFYYLNKGAQSYVFASEDGKYVLKLFKFHHLRLPFFIDYCPLPEFLEKWRIQRRLKKFEQLNKDFLSYKLAYDTLKDETGLVFLHLNRSKGLQQKLILVDRLNIEHRLESDDFAFLIQKKAQLVCPTIQILMENQNLPAAKKAIESLINLVVLRLKKGIDDLDPNLTKNYGFVEERAIQIDCGRFSKVEKALADSCPPFKVGDLVKSGSFYHWLANSYPELAEYFKKLLEQKIEPSDKNERKE
jgi:hypothetical protein